MDWGNPATYIVILGAGGVLVAAGKWIGGMEEFRKTVGGSISQIQADIKEILDRLPRKVAVAESPLKLTDFGEEIASGLDAYTWARSLARELSHGVEGKQPYEIHEFSNEYVHEKLEEDEDWHTRISICAYDYGIDRDGILMVLGVVLRDALLKAKEQE